MDGMEKCSPTQTFHYDPEPAWTILDRAVKAFPDHAAIDFLGRRTSYRDLGRQTNAAAAGLQKLGVQPGVNVGLCLPNTPFFVIMYHAILKAGGTVVNFNPLYTEREIAAQAKDADVTIMVTLDLALIMDKIGNLAAAGAFKHVVVCGMASILPPLKALLFRMLKAKELAKIPDQAPFIKFSTLIAGAPTPAPVSIDPATNIATLQFTGGTTGTPKAAMLTHANIGANVAQILAARPTLRHGEERIAGILPFFHVFAMTAVMNLGLAIGAELLLLPRLDMKQLMRMIERRRPTILPGVPTLYTAISNAALAAGKTDFSFITYCISGGAPIAADTAARFESISKCEILEGYGLSETSPVVTATPSGGVRHGAVGLPLPGTIVEIRDPEPPHALLPQGARGEICVRGPQVMRGYYNRPAETEAAFTAGTFKTGDIGYLDPEGYLFIVDRIKDLILAGGYNVYPRVIEEAAYQHPAVLEAVAIGIPDAYRGQAPKLFVTLRDGETATPDGLKTFLAAHLNKIEMPKAIEIRDSLPKTMVGKLSKKELIAAEAAKTN